MNRQNTYALVAALALLSAASANATTFTASAGGTTANSFAPGPFDRVSMNPTLSGDAQSTTITIGATTTASEPLDPAYSDHSFDFSCFVNDSISVTTGAFSGSVNILAHAGPPFTAVTNNSGLPSPLYNDGHAEVVSNLQTTFVDTGLVTSATLLPGTPVTIKITTLTKGSGYFVGRPIGQDGNGNDDGIGYGGNWDMFDNETLSDINPSYGGNGITSFNFNTRVGDHLTFTGNFRMVGNALAGRDSFSSTTFFPDVFGSVSAGTQMFVSGPGDVAFTADSGHSYALPLQSTPALPAAVVAAYAAPAPGAPGTTFINIDAAASLSAGGLVFHAFTSAGDGIFATQNGALQVVADNSTAIPSGTGNFTRFTIGSIPPSPVRSGDNIVFYGQGSSFQEGIYARINGTLTRIADLNTKLPNSTSTFSRFNTTNVAPAFSLSGSNVAFLGFSGAHTGIYASLNGALTTIADTTTPIPGGSGNFATFVMAGTPMTPAISGNTILFFGAGANGGQGIYRSVSGGPLSTVADFSSTIPGTAQHFQFLQSPVIDPANPTNIAFIGGSFASGGGLQSVGIYASANGGPLTRLIDNTTLFPGTNSPFTSFSALSLDPMDFSFIGSDAAGDTGLFADINGSLFDILNVGDTLDGKLVSSLSLSPEGFSESSGTPIVAFQVTFDDSSNAIYTTAIPAGAPEPASFLTLAALLPLALRRPQKQKRTAFTVRHRFSIHS